jgi:hypothetical protein
MKRMQHVGTPSLWIAALALGGCSDTAWKGSTGPELVEISVSPRVIAVGEMAQAVAVPKNPDGTTISSSRARVAYSSADPSVASVERESGRITGVAPGRAVIFAAFGGSRAGDTVRVVAR